MVLTIRWRSFFEYLTTEELAKPEATSKTTTGARTQVEAHITARVGVQRSLPSLGILPANLSLPSKGGFWQGLQQAED